MGDPGSVGWQFERMTYFAIPDDHDFDTIFEIAVEAGADDIKQDDDVIEIFGRPNTYQSIADHLTKAHIKPEDSGIRFLPKQEITLDTEKTLKVMKTIENLEELDDVQNIYSNLNITEDAIQAMENS